MMNSLRLLRNFTYASLCALLAYCLLTMTLSPVWVFLGVVPYGLIGAIIFALPVYLLMRRWSKDGVVQLWFAACVVCLLMGVVCLTAFDPRTVLAFAMPMSARWQIPTSMIAGYWLLTLVLACGVGSLMLKRFTQRSSEPRP